MFTTTTYKGREYTVPVTGPKENLGSMLTEVPDDDHAMAFLMQDGNLGVPGGRYGSDTVTCAPIALILAKIFQTSNGEPIDYHGLDHGMGLVVNSHDDVAYMLREYGPLVGVDPADYLEDDDLVSEPDEM